MRKDIFENKVKLYIFNAFISITINEFKFISHIHTTPLTFLKFLKLITTHHLSLSKYIVFTQKQTQTQTHMLEVDHNIWCNQRPLRLEGG